MSELPLFPTGCLARHHGLGPKGGAGSQGRGEEGGEGRREGAASPRKSCKSNGRSLCPQEVSSLPVGAPPGGGLRLFHTPRLAMRRRQQSKGGSPDSPKSMMSPKAGARARSMSGEIVCRSHISLRLARARSARSHAASKAVRGVEFYITRRCRAPPPPSPRSGIELLIRE